MNCSYNAWLLYIQYKNVCGTSYSRENDSHILHAGSIYMRLDFEKVERGLFNSLPKLIFCGSIFIAHGRSSFSPKLLEKLQNS